MRKIKKKKPFFSIGIIFKNEIRCLERCLQSLQKLRKAVKCEVVMADTGSTDGSREIAEKYADILFDFEWIDDFAAARNAVMDRCSGEWYFSVDADEWLAEDISELIRFSKAKKISRDFGGIMIRNYKTADLEKSGNYVDFSAVRLARLSTGIRYTGRIHEKWVNESGESIFLSVLGKSWLYHDGYAYFSAESIMKKHDRNMALLEKKLEENPKDLQTYIECMDSSKGLDDKCPDYTRKSLEVFQSDLKRWGHFGGLVYRGLVSAADLHNMPELEEWIEQSREYESSVFVNIDVAYVAFSHYYEKNDYEKAVPWGECYRKGVADYEAENFEASELTHGVVEHVSPFWRSRVAVSLTECYLTEKKNELAHQLLQELSAKTLDAQQSHYVTLMTLRLHRQSELDTDSIITAFWENLKEEQTEAGLETEQKTPERLADFEKTAYETFTPTYRQEEREREEFARHAYTAFLPLAGRNQLGDAAAILEETDAQRMMEILVRAEKVTDFPVHVISHAIRCGVEFPIPNQPMKVDEMDGLVTRMTSEKADFWAIVQQAYSQKPDRTLQSLCWNRGLALAALRVNDWKQETDFTTADTFTESEETTVKRSLGLARFFARVEEKFLPTCYAPEALQEERLFILPPVHRFGWYCAQAFRKLDNGDRAGYLHLLRAGLASCEGMKDVVEFLTEHTPELREAQTPQPSEELKMLADQVRKILANYAPDDPAVSFLKQSDAYQKVSYLIEGTAVPVMGGALQ